MSRIEFTMQQLQASRFYTNRLLDTVPESDWFRQPSDGVTHVAWQVGHLAFARHGLGLVRIRGARDDDDRFIPPEFKTLFGRGSTPGPSAGYPTPRELRAVYDAVHLQCLRELQDFPEERLDELLDPPHLIAKTKFDSLIWCANHELVHAGQIALLRRLLNHDPMW